MDTGERTCALSKGALLADYLLDFFKDCRELQAKKRHDYTGPHGPFYNYEKSGEMVGISAGQSMLARLTEKVVRLALALDGNTLQVNDESFTDTCRDGAILFGLIAAWHEDERDPGVLEATILRDRAEFVERSKVLRPPTHWKYR